MRKLESHEIACYIYKNNLMDKSDNLQFSKLILFNNMLKANNDYIFSLATFIWALSSEQSFEKIYCQLDDITTKEIY